MERFLLLVTEVVADLHTNHILKLASLLKSQIDEKTVIHEFGGAFSSMEPMVKRIFDAWRTTGVSAEELAGILLGASHAYHYARREESIELVWTGPTTEFVSVRRTEQVLIETIRSSRKQLFLSSFVSYDSGTIVESLAEAMARGVGISILLESSDRHGGTLQTDVIGDMKTLLPEATFLHWKNRAGFMAGKVHAKVLLVDGRSCFLSSANLTRHAMEKNMEAGVLIRGGDIPHRLMRHFEMLVEKRILSVV